MRIGALARTTHPLLLFHLSACSQAQLLADAILNMGLPVKEIMAEVEEELMNMNEEELDHMDGEVH